MDKIAINAGVGTCGLSVYAVVHIATFACPHARTPLLVIFVNLFTWLTFQWDCNETVSNLTTRHVSWYASHCQSATYPNTYSD